jgi:acyl carrier protein
MRRALDEARSRWGPVEAVVHAAGIAGNDRVAFRKSEADVRAVLAPKLDGLAVLVRLLGEAPLDLVALVGSVTALAGGAGLCDYAAANAVLGAFPESTARPAAWRRVLTLDFSAWREVGMAVRTVVPAERRQAWDELLRAGIGPTEGADAVARALASGRARLAVSPFDLAEGLARSRRPHAAEPAAPPPPREPEEDERSSLGSPYQAPAGEVEQRLAAIWSELLGVQRIGVHDDFFQLGGHSLLATRVIARIEEALGAHLTLRDVFDAPTISRLSARLAAAPAAAGARQEEREELEF